LEVGRWQPHALVRARARRVGQNNRQLYIDGIRASRTRGRLPVDLIKTDTGYTAADSVMAKWRNPSDIEFVYTGGNAIWFRADVRRSSTAAARWGSMVRILPLE